MPTEDSASTAAAITRAATMIHQPRPLEETLDAIVRAAQQSLPFGHAGISLTHADGRIETLAGTDQLVWDLDALQYDLGEGPCVDSMRGEDVVVVEHARHEQRWPRYLPQAVRSGLRAQLALRLHHGEATIGGLNLYSTDAETIDADTLDLAGLLAAHAAIALGRARTESQLTEALASRKVIGQAIGLLMARYDMDEDRAFDFLVRGSSTGHVKLRDIAQQLVDSANHAARSTDG